MNGSAELAKELAYRLHLLCERSGWAEDAVAYITLVVAWPEIAEEARQQARQAAAPLQFAIMNENG
jgi:putative DNA methylase